MKLSLFFNLATVLLRKYGSILHSWYKKNDLSYLLKNFYTWCLWLVALTLNISHDFSLTNLAKNCCRRSGASMVWSLSRKLSSHLWDSRSLQHLDPLYFSLFSFLTVSVCPFLGESYIEVATVARLTALWRSESLSRAHKSGFVQSDRFSILIDWAF